MASLSKREVTRAGEVFVCPSSSSEEKEAARQVVAKWRSAHEEPMQQMISTLNAIAKDCAGAIVVGRLKRAATIIEKLQRPGYSYDLKTLDDIAGCRIVLPAYESVFSILEALQAHPSYRKTKDYLAAPKESGYRGVHSLHRFDSVSTGLSNLRVEVQVRSKREHCWATAVESYDVLSGANLKFGMGSDDERRFFLLAAALVALEEEGKPLFDSVPSKAEIIIEELRELESRTHILARLEAFSDSALIIDPDEDKGKIFIISFEDSIQTVTIIAYALADQEKANRDYYRLEKEYGDDGFVLLVTAESMANLFEAYPNYFTDISGFLGWMKKYIF